MPDDAGAFIAHEEVAPQSLTQSAQERLRQLIARIEKLEEEKATVAADIKEVYAEAKSNGFDVKILRQVIRLRKMDKAALQEQDALLELYRDALDMTPDNASSAEAAE